MTLPLESGRGLYSGLSGIGGGVGRALFNRGKGVSCGLAGFSRGCSCFLMLNLYVAGIDETGATDGRFALSPAVTGRGPSFTFGFKKSKRSFV